MRMVSAMPDPSPSPTARAMAQAFDDRYELCTPFDGNWHEVCLAAALRVLADQVVPEDEPPRGGMRPGGTGALTLDEAQQFQRAATRRKILAIAAELAAEPTPTTELHD